MHLVGRAKNLMIGTGTEWVLWVLVVLSVASIAVIVERIVALRSLRGDVEKLRACLRDALREGGFARARKALAGSNHPGTRVVLRAMQSEEREIPHKQAEDPSPLA